MLRNTFSEKSLRCQHVAELITFLFISLCLEGRPVYILRLGSMDVKGLLKAVGEDGFLKYVSTVKRIAFNKCVRNMYVNVATKSEYSLHSLVCLE